MDTRFRRRASHAGSGEKYIKFVNCCPKAARRVLSKRLVTHLPLIKIFVQINGLLFAYDRRPRDIHCQLYAIRRFLPPALLLQKKLSSLNPGALHVDTIGSAKHRFIG
ncbi:hypothetical protein [Caballeronia sp. 15715]|uniref:hypothetical protein n=1 Tax=unclassified Caballeronia TaxID=2646786 RepID=UPI0039E4EAE8